MPAEAAWIINRCAADLTSRSLQADATSASLRRANHDSPQPNRAKVGNLENKTQTLYPPPRTSVSCWRRHKSCSISPLRKASLKDSRSG